MGIFLLLCYIVRLLVLMSVVITTRFRMQDAEADADSRT